MLRSFAMINYAFLLMPMLLTCGEEEKLSAEEKADKAIAEKVAQTAEKTPTIADLRSSWDEKISAGSGPSFDATQARSQMYQSYDFQHFLYEEPEEDAYTFEESECEKAGTANQSSFSENGNVLKMVYNGSYECSFLGRSEESKYTNVDVATYKDCELDGIDTECTQVTSELYGISLLECDGADFSQVTVEALNSLGFLNRFCGESGRISIKSSYNFVITNRTRRLHLLTDKAGCFYGSEDLACYEEKETFYEIKQRGLQQTSDGKACEATIAAGVADFGSCLKLNHAQNKFEGFTNGFSMPAEVFTEISFPALKSKVTDKWYFGSNKGTIKLNDWSGELIFDPASSANAPSYKLTKDSEILEGNTNIDPACYAEEVATRPGSCPQ